ncbi:MAG: thiamine pyrophosphate-dependent enzyme [Microbacteriaceae bacterium]
MSGAEARDLEVADGPLSTGELLELYRRMSLIRAFEEVAARLYREGEIPGFVHLSIGQEATAVGACAALDAADGIVSTHRGHGHCLAKGATVETVLAELMGRATGVCGGLGGSMHIADVRRGIYGANGIVAAGLPIACGVAAAARRLGDQRVALAFFGDGAIGNGAFHEALNLAALWRLAVVFLCENNGFAEFSPFEQSHPVPVTGRAAAYGIPAISVDGNDVEAVLSAVGRAVTRARAGDGPMLIEATTFRMRGHYEGDPERYRHQGETAAWAERDPLAVTRARLAARGVAIETVDAVDADVARELAAALERVRTAPVPSIADARRAVSAARPDVGEELALTDEAGYRVMDAVHDALDDALSDDPTVWLAGIDVAQGNVFGVTRGLAAAHPGRVHDTPISETAIVGMAVGAAMAGTRPVIEIMYADFFGVCFDQLLNQAAKIRFMTGGAVDVPLVVRTQCGAGRSSAAQHSQSLEALLAHVPGLSVVMPSTPADTYGLLRSAIDDPNPVIVIDHRLLYGLKDRRPERGHRVPIGRGVLRRHGTHLTVAAWSRACHLAMVAADLVAAEGISTEVIDMRSIAPLDLQIIIDSVRRTGKLLVVHEAVLTGGVGAEIAAALADACFWDLDAPIRRLAPEPIPAPYSPLAEAAWMLHEDKIVAAIRDLMSV